MKIRKSTAGGGEAGKEEQTEGEGEEEADGYWPAYTLKWFSSVKDEIDTAEWTLPQWKPLHNNNAPDSSEWSGRAQNRVLRYAKGNKVWDHCRVHPDLYEPGFPCLEGPMPARKRNRGN